MSSNLDELCRSVVEEVYGEFHARLFSRLTYHGRLSAQQLAQKIRMPFKQVKIGLATLIQQRLVYRHSAVDGLSTYQANTTAAYDLLRVGKLVRLARNQFGQVAATAVSEACLLGFTTVSELETRTLDTIQGERSRTTNGSLTETEEDDDILKEVRHAIVLLLENDYFRRLRSTHLQTHLDARRDAEIAVKNSGFVPSSKGKKGQIELEARIDDELRRRMTSDTPEYGNVSGASMGEKRSLDEAESSRGSKRQRLDRVGTAKTNKTVAVEVQPSGLLICVDFQNLVSQTRNDFVTQRAKKCLGGTNSRVLEAALSQILHPNPWDQPVAEYWLDCGNLRDQLNSPPNHQMTNGATQNGTSTNGFHEGKLDNLDEEKMSYKELDRSLALLASSEFSFLQGEPGKDQWKIIKGDLVWYVQEREALRMMGNRIGPPALRIIRMLTAKGKLDEKTLQEIGLLGAKDLRHTLALLKQMGYVDLQEVPREAQRQPNRTIFLWFHDPDRTRKVLLEGLYKAMSRLMQRLKSDKAKMTSTLEKAERSDVQGHEQERMGEAEWRVLKRWQRKEEWLLGEVARLDESVTLLRDL